MQAPLLYMEESPSIIIGGIPGVKDSKDLEVEQLLYLLYHF